MNRTQLKIIVLGILFLSLASCVDQSNQPESSSGEETGSISLSIVMPELNASSAPGFKLLGTQSEITQVYLDIYQLIGGQRLYHITDHSLTYSGSSWTGIVYETPLNVVLTFVVRAQNSETIEIFSGNKQTTLQNDNDNIDINLDPVDDQALNVLPIITRIEVPTEFVRTSVNGNVNFFFKGSSNETLTYTITPNSDGIFVPASGSITMGSAGTATLVSNYTAPSSTGNYNYKVRLTNSQNNYVAIRFPTTIVEPSSTPVNADISTLINPVITSISGERITDSTSDAIHWQADATSDTGPLSFEWSYNGTGGLIFTNPTTNPAILDNYITSAEGAVTIEITDGDGGLTEVGFSLKENQFPTVQTKYLEYLLPDTGQDEKLATISGEDADYELNPLGYTDNGDNTITDNNTLLMWENTNRNSAKWNSSKNACSNATTAGYTDWRLPTIHELKDLVYLRTTSPMIDNDFFIPFASNIEYWSSTEGNETATVQALDFSTGEVKQIQYAIILWNNYFENYSGYSVCVRGTASAINRAESSNNTIFDATTKLWWQKEEGTQSTWEDAISYCENLGSNGISDWRLPNIKELYSIIEVSKKPTIDLTLFPNAQGNFYWTSSHNFVDKALAVSFIDGTAQNYSLTESFNVRCVYSQQ